MNLANRNWLSCFLITTVLVAGYSSQYLGNDDLANLGIAFLILFAFNDQTKLELNPLLLAALLTVGVIGVAASSISKFPDISFQRLTLYRNLLFLGFAFYLLLQQQLVVNATAIYLAIVAAFLLTMPITLYEYFSYSAMSADEGQRFIAPKLTYYGHIRHFSYHAFFASCAATLLLTSAKRFKTVIIVVLALSVAALIASTGRGAIIAYLIFVFLLVRNAFSMSKAISAVGLCVLAIFAVLAILLLTPAAPLTESIILRSQYLTNPDQLLSGRLGFWKNALVSVNQSPLLGLGPEGYRWSHEVPPSTRQPHNSLVQLFVEFGYFGGTVILLAIARVLQSTLNPQLMRDSAAEKQFSGLNAFLIATVVYSLVDGVFYHQLPLLHMTILMPLWFAYNQHRSQCY